MAEDSIFRRQSLFTDPTGARATVTATLPGMMHFSATGPAGTVCGDCAHWRGNCTEFERRLAQTIPVPKETPSCRHWLKAPQDRVTRNFALAEDNINYRAEIESGHFIISLEALAASGYRASVILADPPWQFSVRSERGLGRSPERHYAPSAVSAALPNAITW